MPLEGNGTPLQYSCLENPMDRGAWWAAVHGVTKSQTRLSDFTFTFHFHALEEEMSTHSSGLAWRLPGTAEPGGLPSMGSHRVRHDWSHLAAAAAKPLDVRKAGRLWSWHYIVNTWGPIWILNQMEGSISILILFPLKNFMLSLWLKDIWNRKFGVEYFKGHLWSNGHIDIKISFMIHQILSRSAFWWIH